MKKLFFLFTILILISGCSLKQPQVSTIDENNAPKGINNYDDSQAISEMNAIKNGATPKVKPTGKPTEPMQKEQEQPKQVQLEDLAKDYSQAVLKTNFGDIKVKFYGSESPLTVNNFLNLAKKGFYNETKFHRVIKDFMIQGGDPNSKDDDWSNDGMGGPGYQFQDEFNSHKLVRGSLAMANSGPNTNGSQFFIVTAKETPWLDGKHTNFGEVVSGMDVVLKIENVQKNENDHPTQDVIVKSIELVK